MATRTTASGLQATPEALKQKQSALEHVRIERAKIEEVAPRLAAAVKTAREALEKAQLDVFVARGTPGFEDDQRAEASVEAAQTTLDDICEEREATQERLRVLERADKRLEGEIGEINGALQLAHWERSKAKLRERIESKRPELIELVKDIAALRFLDSQTTWNEELHLAMGAATGENIQTLIRAGQDFGQRVRAGAEVEPDPEMAAEEKC